MASVRIALVVAVRIAFCAITCRSPVADVPFVPALRVISAPKYTHAPGDIGITMGATPIISLGIDLGVGYGIYCMSRVRDERRRDAAEGCGRHGASRH